MEFPVWFQIVLGLPLSTIYYRHSPSIKHVESEARPVYVPNPLTRTLGHLFRLLDGLLLVINTGI